MASRQYRSKDLKQPPKSPFDDVDIAGVAIRFFADPAINPPYTHVGLLYKPEDGAARLCHLKSHRELVDEIPASQYSWVDMQIEPLLKKLIRSECRIVASRNTKIPFGFAYDPPYFTPGTGELVEKPIGIGLTCSTFILAILKMAEIVPLDLPSWQARIDDTIVQGRQIEAMKFKMGSEYTAALEKQVGDVRVRPEEIIVGVTTEPRPVNFDKAKEDAEKVIEDLRKHATKAVKASR